AAAAVQAALRRRRPPAGPRSEDGHYARVGTVAHIEEMGRTPGGTTALVIRGLHRAIIGSGIAGTGDATWVQIEARRVASDGLHRPDAPTVRMPGGPEPLRVPGLRSGEGNARSSPCPPRWRCRSCGRTSGGRPSSEASR